MGNISEIGQKMLQMQAELAEAYGYCPQPEEAAEGNMRLYIRMLPECFSGKPEENGKGYSIPSNGHKILTLDGMLLAEKYERVVIGQYGAFIEFLNDDAVRRNIMVQPGQEYRYSPEWMDKVRYYWCTAKDGSGCKLYYQRKPVVYADYKAGRWYVSPYEVSAGFV